MCLTPAQPEQAGTLCSFALKQKSNEQEGCYVHRHLHSPDNGLLLKVPGTLTGKWNPLFNPRHSAAGIISKAVAEPFYFDPRFRLQQDAGSPTPL
ncbi:hypothetical protein F3I27_05130 [Pantoea sp. Bo_2]|uniref:hypothetical protein n=1 Tax=unclassified Pantoea TaxID=2630326 RepID=UPI001231BC15|nr:MULTISPECIES: hypothetical protein [unclassified Pantoea]KAA5950326.1 hypothetical protein F3I57_01855 [Pantoea sp. VH_3]KAA5955698.1 hypothetical protein F3I56_03585 [Pantoea sp. VH_25]KAA5960139.1 hypothetical protein F3I55_03075 [Pantoea sp. VH_24]KAA5963765.1 hypothetical protein F3I53_03150 [Pantoea sp. VH_16]KAA5967939.1 hypothetical protein F3I54_03565 [Pantoea sp. VH_18]